MFAFGEFARARGAASTADLPGHVEAFVAGQVSRPHACARSGSTGGSTVGGAVGNAVASEVRGPIEQMLAVVLPAYTPRRRRDDAMPFAVSVPGFFAHLAQERGLRPDTTMRSYRYHLGRFEAFLQRAGVETIRGLSPTLLTAFAVERAAKGLAPASLRTEAGVLRVFLRYVYRERLVGSDLSAAVEAPQARRLATIPRSIGWEDVNAVLAGVDRRTGAGRRDYAILLLLITYGLRGQEIARLTLDDIDWKRERLAVPQRKAGHSTAFPLTATVGEAIVDYLRDGRPATSGRHVFITAVAPRRPLSDLEVSGRARHHLLRAGIDVPRLGSHTLRHTTAQRLVDAGFDLKTIGDFIGHRSPRSTEIYAKVAVEALRKLAQGDGEDVLA